MLVYKEEGVELHGENVGGEQFGLESQLPVDGSDQVKTGGKVKRTQEFLT